MSRYLRVARRVTVTLASSMPTRYQRTRGLLLLGGVLFAWADHDDPLRDALLSVNGIICFVGYLLAGLMKHHAEPPEQGK